MAGQHLAVRVDVDAFALRLPEHFFEVLEVVAGDDDALALDRRDADLRRLGMAVGLRIGGVQQLHRLEIDLARLERARQEFIGIGGLTRQVVEHFLDGGVVRLVLLAQDLGMVGVRGDALEPVHDQLLQTRDRRTEFLHAFIDADLAAFARQRVEIGRGPPTSARGSPAAPGSGRP